VIFDAILVKKSERAPILAAAREFGVTAVAVWFRTPLAACIARNAARPPDQVANEQGLRNVFAAVEPPNQAEGFAYVLEVPDSDA
jgi:predicted kinase